MKKAMATIIVTLFLASMLSMAFVTPAKAQYLTDDYTMGLWHFNEGTGTTASDSSGYNNHGTIHGATWDEGRFGKALSFDGVDDYVEVPDSEKLDLTEFTIEAWIYVKVLKKYNAIVVKGPDMLENYEVLVGYPGLGDVHSPIRFTVGRYWLSTGPVIAINTWYHVAVTYKPGEWRIYVDGVKRAERTDITDTPAINDYPLWIGNEQGTTGRVMDGLIDEVRISNVARVPVDIDIKPGSDQNSICLSDSGLLPVAILSTATFDATEIDLEEPLLLGGAAVSSRGSWKAPKIASSIEDVDGDSDLDMMVFFSVPDLVSAGLTTTTTMLELTATLTDGTHITGTDSVRIVPP